MNCDKCHEPIDYPNDVFYVTEGEILCEPCHLEGATPHNITEELESCAT